MMIIINLRRVYDKKKAEEEFRILVDRLWPRGFSKKSLEVDVWARDIAPSNQLRKWYSHELSKWQRFRDAYCRELESKREQVKSILRQAQNKKITLLYAAKDHERNNAVVLREFMLQLEI